ncbi:hypothetical protein BGZ46_006058 [Entomortierella lignicola]|nr:hypothetical protein BGZ46_006058 [Entomortierella lignicola]
MNTVLHIPHLTEEIALNLSQHDLTRCALVSRDWNTWFSPTLWLNPSFKRAIKKDELKMLVQHRNSVRSILNLHLLRQLLTENDLIVTFPQLHSIQLVFEKDFNNSLLATALDMVERTPTLQSLSLSVSSNPLPDHQLPRILRSSSRLRELSFRSSKEYYLDEIQEIVEAGSKLHTLQLNLWQRSSSGRDSPGLWSRDSQSRIAERTVIAKELFRKMQETNIRELVFESHHESMGHDLLLSLLEKSPRLERLCLAGRYKSVTIDEIAGVLQTGVCPLLAALEFRDIRDTKYTPGELANLIRSIGSNGSGGLETLSLFTKTRFGHQTISALTKCHAKTLTTLVWPQLTSLNLSLFGDLLRGLPKLQTLQAKVWLNLRTKDGPDMDSVFNKQWNCPDMINLEIDLGLSCNFHATIDKNWKGSLSDRSMTYAISQIGRLRTLRKLELSSEVALLTLSGPGYLRMLSNLKQLGTLRFDRWADNEMGSGEAEWMIENWPRLIRVIEVWRLRTTNRGRVFDDFTRTLVKKRPWLQIG